MSIAVKKIPYSQGREGTAAELEQSVLIPRIAIQAFGFADNTLEILNSVADDRRMRKAHLKVQKGGIQTATQYFASSATPNLLILETDQEGNDLLTSLGSLAEVCDAETKVLIIGKTNDVNLYRELMARGISEYLVGPVTITELIGSISQLYCKADAAPLGRTFAVIGAKGGCGASMIAHNVSWVLSKKAEVDVALADLDLAFGTAGLDFNEDPLQGIAEAMGAPERIDETLLDRLLCQCNERLNLLAAPASLEQTYEYSEDTFELLIETMRKGTPAVVLDIPHAWSNWVRKVLTGADEIIIVAEPDLANLRNTKNMVDLLAQLRPNDKAPYLLLNKVNMPKRPEIKPQEFAEKLNVDLLPSIQFDAAVFGEAALNGQMVAETDKRKTLSSVIEQIAFTVLGRENTRGRKHSFLSPLLSKLGKVTAG
ncbi:AAA family ATPase [Flexibacterium corallicola]|uniref:AAA family ATPase n=1 Tax=Flexibacterium corallicola TaxID=3037259 RepID=UPI00286ECE93|nr:CtpF protein [Pseudovibrio sp. M1P-2-3]